MYLSLSISFIVYHKQNIIEKIKERQGSKSPACFCAFLNFPILTETANTKILDRYICKTKAIITEKTLMSPFLPLHIKHFLSVHEYKCISCITLSIKHIMVLVNYFFIVILMWVQPSSTYG